MEPIPYLLQPPNAPVPGLGEQLATAQQGQQQLARLPAPMMAAPMSGPSLPALSAAVMPAAHPNQVLTDEDRRNHLLNSGAGVDQIHSPWLRGLAKAGDIATQIAGSVFLPAHAVAAAIPGTTFHHQMLLHQATQNLANDQAAAQQDAVTQDQQAQVVQRRALAEQEQAKAKALSDPHKAIDASKTVQTDDGVYQLDPDTGKYDVRVGDRVEKPKPIEQAAYEYALSQGKNPLDAYNAVYNAKNQKADPLPQQYLDALSRGDQTQADMIKRTIQATQVQPKIDVHEATEKPGSTGTWTPGFDADKNPVMFNSKTGEVKPMGSFTKSTATGQKISSDEQKRADMAQNLNENIDKLEEIAKRRPDLFGPISGRMTDAKIAMGSSDPDIAALAAINHQLGMAQMSAHSMRSAQGLERASGSLVNAFHNSPEATISGLEAARQSVRTFMQDSQQPGQARTDGHEAGGATPYSQTATGQGGHKIGSNDNGQTWFDVQTGKQVQ